MGFRGKDPLIEWDDVLLGEEEVKILERLSREITGSTFVRLGYERRERELTLACYLSGRR